MDDTHFQFCPKLAIFDREHSRVLLCKRKGEMDYDGVYSLIGGKMEHRDVSIVQGIAREKNEEVGHGFLIRLLPHFSVNVLFQKQDGNKMILPHYYAEHLSGDPKLSDEYSDWKWVPLSALETWTPMVKNIAWIVPLLSRVRVLARTEDLVEI